MKNVGHGFPESQYPVVRAWLRGEPRVPGDAGTASAAKEDKEIKANDTVTVN